ncbi:MAG: hypothetical protein H7Y18_21050 [Clostridiaceae bacterium]|nr:hypothetical protein [Clostridiaceae bacterium]
MTYLLENLLFKQLKKNNIFYRKLEFPDSDHFYFSQVGIPTIAFASLESSNKLKNFKREIDYDYHTFSDLEKENIIIPKEAHSENDTYDLIEKSNKVNSNFKNLFEVLLKVLNDYSKLNLGQPNQ